MLKTFVFTYDRYSDITTSEYLKNVPHTVLCHTEDARQKFIDAGHIHGEIIATLQPKGLSNNRNYALSLMEPGEWAVFWVDDLISCTQLQDQHLYGEALGITMENQAELRPLFKQPCHAHQFEQLALDTIAVAELKGFALCGFSLTGNPLFRNKHYGYWSLADGRCWLVKKTDLVFDTTVQLIDDTCFTALNLKRFGGVVVNNWVLPDCKRYTPGAYGTKEQRMAQKIAECAYLVKTYGEFITYADKAGWPPFSHVKIRPKSIANELNTKPGLFDNF